MEENIQEGRAFVAAAQKAKDAGEKEFEFNGKTYPVTIKDQKKKEKKDKKTNEVFLPSFSEFLNEGKKKKSLQKNF